MDNQNYSSSTTDTNIKLEESHPDEALNYFNSGLTLYHQQKYDEAITQFKKAIEIKPDYAEAYYRCGLALSQLGQYDEAIAQFKKTIEIKPDYAEAYYRCGLALSQLGQYDEAIAQFKKTIEIKPDYAEAYFHSGLALSQLGQNNEAIAQYKKAIEIKPDYAEAYYRCGLALSRLGQNNEAIAQYQKATEIQSDDVFTYYNWGLALHELGRYDEAIVQYQKVTEIQPDFVAASAYYSWGRALYELKRYNEAIAQYQKATQVDADFAYAYHNLAYTLEKQGRYQEARDKWIKACQAYEKMIPSAEKNKDADSLFYYGSILYEILGELKQAELIFQKGLLLNAEHPDILKQLGELYLEWHDDYPYGLDSSTPEITSAYYGKAYEYFTKASTILKKRNDDAKNSLDYLRLGELLLRMEDYDEAEKHFLDLTKQNSAFMGEANAHLGVLYSMYPEKENLRLAAQYFEKALKNDPDNLTIWSNLAEVYLRLKLMEKAETAYKKILRRARNHLDTRIGLGEFYVALAENQDEDQYKQAIQYFTNSINLAGSPNRSKRLRNKELAAIYYSRGYARVKFYEYEKPIGDYSLLIDALADFKECFRLDKDHHKSERAIEKIEAVLNKTRHYSRFSEKVGPWFVVIPSACVFLFTQASLFFNMPHMPLVIKDTGSYLTLTFLPLLFIIIGLYLPNILRIKFPGVELEKSSIQQISTPSSLGIKK